MIQAAQLVAAVNVTGVPEGKAQLKSMSSAVEETSTGFKGMLGNALSFAAGQFVFNAVGQAVGFLKDQFVSVFQDAMDAQAAMAQTVQVLKSTHDASGLTAQSVVDLADKMSRLTLFNKDTTESAENMLLTFTNIGKNVFPLATQTVLDMSQALGQDTKSSAIQLGKALNDPIQGISALQRVGVTFTDSQKNLIKSLVDSGNVAGAQKVILAELQKEFGGSAEAAGKTFPGQLQILGQSFDDIKEKIGQALLPMLQNLTGWVQANAVPAFDRFSDWFTKTGLPALQHFGGFVQTNIMPIVKQFETVFSGLGKGPAAAGLQQVSQIVGGQFNANFKMAALVVQELGRWWQTTMLPAIQQAMPGFQHLASVVATTVVPSLAKIWVVGQQLAREAIPPLVKAFETLEPIIVRVGGWLANQLGNALQFIAPYAVQAAQAIGQFATDIATRVQPIVQGLSIAIGAFLSWIGPYWPQVWGQITSALTNAWSIIKGVVQIGWAFISGVIKVGLDLLSGNWKGAWDDIKSAFSGAWEGMKSIVSGVWGFIGGTVKSGVNYVIKLINGFISGLDAMHINVPGIGNVGFSVPLIPYLAEGGLISKAGLAIVGERGPEVVALPRGAQVIPNSQAFGGGQPQIIVQPPPIYLDGHRLTMGLMPYLMNAIRYGTSAGF